MRRVYRVILALAYIAGLNDEVPPGAIQARPVQHVVLLVVEIDRVPVSQEPVIVVADEQVGVAPAEEGASNPVWCNKAAAVGKSAKQGLCEWLLPNSLW